MPALMLSVFTDEVSDDFEVACRIAAEEFELRWVELRKLWGKNIMLLDGRELAEARRILGRYGLRVSQIGGPLFKTDLKGAPLSSERPKRDTFGDFTWDQQPEVLERGLELCKVFQCDRLRCFDFWRLEDPLPFHTQIDEELGKAASACGKQRVTLSMENEFACNTRTGAEAKRTLAAVKSPWFKLNWDPGNAYFAGEDPFPGGFSQLPVARISNVHIKDAARDDAGKYQWLPVGKGKIDFVGQFRALAKAGYRGPITLETHYRGAVTAEASTRESMAGLKAALKGAGLL